MIMELVPAAGDIEAAIAEGLQKLGFESLKEQQRAAIVTFLQQKDTFVSLPTGYGKSIIYAMLPYVFDRLRGKLCLYACACSSYQ